jgi:SMC interacting uncharacterized protein involved in chromosome segregation
MRREIARPRWVPLAASAFAVLLLAQPAVAQDASKKAAAKASTPKAKPNVMTRDELRTCMNEQDRLKEARTLVEQEQTALDQQRDQVKAMDAELKKKIAAFDPAVEGAKKALEEEAAKFDDAADAYNSRLKALREKSQAHNTEQQAWVEKCANRNFDEMDEAAIKKERRLAAEKARK